MGQVDVEGFCCLWGGWLTTCRSARGQLCRTFGGEGTLVLERSDADCQAWPEPGLEMSSLWVSSSLEDRTLLCSCIFAISYCKPSIRASNMFYLAGVSVRGVLGEGAGLAPLARPRMGPSVARDVMWMVWTRGALGPWRSFSRCNAGFGRREETAGEHVFGSWSSWEQLRNRSNREFQGYLVESVGCSDWSFDIRCRRSV
ncbi:unnamed protein product [Prunus brigantina]